MTGTIVFASEFWFGCTGAGLAHGLRQLDWDVAEIDVREHMMLGRTPAMRLAARILRRDEIASYNKAILGAVDRLRPKAFLTVKGSFLRPDTIAEIRRRGIPTINYYTDFHFDHPGLDTGTFAHYDLFFTTKSFQLEYLRARLGEDRVRFLHHGYASLVNRPRLPEVTEDDYFADVLYAGNYSPYKERWIEGLTQRLPDLNLKIIGSGWKAAPRLAKWFTGGQLTGDGYSRAIQRARINLAIHFGPGPHGWQDLVSRRTFEIPACKGFMLHIDSEEIRTLFEPGAEIEVFSHPDDLAEKVVVCLESPERRREMIERAFLRCTPAYSFDKRAEVIADAIKAQRSA